MKILQLTCHFSPNVGGVETHLEDLVNILAEKRHEVFVLTYRPLTTKVSWKIFEKRKFIQILRIPWFPGFFYELVGTPAMEFLYLLPGLFAVTPFVLLRQKSDVVHAHGLIAGFVGVLWGKILRKRVVVSTHNIYHFPKKGLYAKFVRWIFSHADAVLCLSNQSKEEVIALSIPRENVHVFTYWIDQELFHKIPHAKRELSLPQKFTVLFVGRLVEEKGVQVLLESAKSWNKDIVLIAVGMGPLEKFVKKVADGIGIRYIGKVSQTKLPLYYSAAEVLIVPSIHEEGFGRVLLESLSCGTPVIAANRGGIKEAITDKVGYMLTITPENIKKAVEYCLEHRLELEKKSKEARLFAKKRFAQKNAETILSSYY